MKNKLILVILVISVICLYGCGASANIKSNKKTIASTKYGSVVFKNVSYDNGKAYISGTVDLPNGSNLDIGFCVDGRPNTEVDDIATVTNNSFSSVLTISDQTTFAGTLYYDASVFFSPYEQENSIIKLVGKNGENLSGRDIEIRSNTVAPSFKVLNVTKKINAVK